jgi:hypothetical protein
MAIIHDTTLSPGKLELLAGWLPGSGQLIVRVNRVLQPDGTQVRGTLAAAQHVQMPATR